MKTVLEHVQETRLAKRTAAAIPGEVRIRLALRPPNIRSAGELAEKASEVAHAAGRAVRALLELGPAASAEAQEATRNAMAAAESSAEAARLVAITVDGWTVCAGAGIAVPETATAKRKPDAAPPPVEPAPKAPPKARGKKS